MLSLSVSAAALLAGLAGLPHLASAASKEAIYVGSNAQDISDKSWQSVLDSPNATSSAKFPGFDLSKPYPGTEQDGWELAIAVKSGVDSPGSDTPLTVSAMAIASPDGDVKVDDSWHICVYTFTVHPSSAASWGSGKTPSCDGLIAPECSDDLTKNAVKKFTSDGCPDYSTTASCLRDLDDQTSMALSLSASDASSVFGGNMSFFRQVDAAVGAVDAFDTAASQPMAVVTVWGPSGSSDQDPTAEIACVLPNAEPATGAASNAATALLGWSAVSAAAALYLVL